ncbi:MAG: phosphoadenylyl-sulfate reductase [Alphaproteobacteria bacterium]|nr:phosphoadenylyl-sulfate reductase [Alphaproteobacteria bacterium]
MDLQRTARPSQEVLNTHYAKAATAQDILRQALQTDFVGRIAVVSSFGAEAVVLLHLVSQIDPTTPIIFLNTGKLFGETLRYRDRLQEALGLTDIRSLAPHPDDIAKSDPKGGLWRQDTDACCHIRKVLPQARAIEGFDAIITGRKRFQTNAREEMNVIEQDTENSGGHYRINPLANWSLDELRLYIEKHNLPRHPLVKDGFLSIGCMPCTDRVQEGGNYRDGRWAGTDKDECGIHINTGGDGI